MLRSAMLSIAFIIAIQCLAITTTESLSVHFSYDDHQLDQEAKNELLNFLNGLDLEADHMFVVSGHTDDDGSFSYNDHLSERRALSVKAFLEQNGVESEAITLRSFGERDPLVANISEEDHRKNRRVSISFEKYLMENMGDLEHKLGEGSATEFSIDPGKRNYLWGRNGCIVKIPKNAIVDAQGNVISGHVQVRMTEALDLEQFIASDLSTVTDDGRMLISGGMLRMEAFDENGDPLALDPNAEMIISIPSQEREDGMQLFVSDDGADWEETGQAARRLPELKLPDRPQLVYPRFVKPTYKTDLASKPRKPYEPVRPREPNEPRRESYNTTTHWYDYLSRHKIKARDQVRYEQAMIRYGEKVERFDSRMTKYHEECAEFPTRNAEFKTAHKAWKEKILADSIHFLDVIIPDTYDAHQKHVDKHTDAYNKRMEVWQARCDTLMEAYTERLDSLGLADVDNVNRYIFSSNRLGWINCDRFYDVPQAQKFNLVVQDSDTIREKVYVVFTEMKSMIQLYKRNGRYCTNNIPTG